MRLIRLTAGALWLACACSGSTSPYSGPAGGSAGSGGYGGSGAGGGSANAVTVSNNFYSPVSTTVAVGTTVTWTWSSAGTAHTVTMDTGSVSSGTQSSGTYTLTFTVAGTYNYHCAVHGAGMYGTIVVN